MMKKKKKNEEKSLNDDFSDCQWQCNLVTGIIQVSL